MQSKSLPLGMYTAAAIGPTKLLFRQLFQVVEIKPPKFFPVTIILVSCPDPPPTKKYEGYCKRSGAGSGYETTIIHAFIDAVKYQELLLEKVLPVHIVIKSNGT